ncbi:MAG TPA: hypothetical protein DGG95_10520 [Cytophagales bacterium]|nr:hypothetical protein [Cytophagales bacterium]
MKKTLDQETAVEKILIAEVRLVEEETVIGDGEITNENGRAQFDPSHIWEIGFEYQFWCHSKSCKNRFLDSHHDLRRRLA